MLNDKAGLGERTNLLEDFPTWQVSIWNHAAPSFKQDSACPPLHPLLSGGCHQA